MGSPDVQERVHRRAQLSVIDALQGGRLRRPGDEAMLRADCLLALPLGFRPDAEGMKKRGVIITV